MNRELCPMKFFKLFFSIAILTVGCTHTEVTPTKKDLKLLFEEYYDYDVANSSSPDGFVPSYKLAYKYDQGMLTKIDEFDYNLVTHAYEQSYPFEEYHYNNEDKLVERIKFVGISGLRFIYEYDYSNTQTKVTSYESADGNSKNLTDWWTIDRTPSSLDVKYYQGNNELYDEAVAEIDAKGNVVSLGTNPSLSVGKVYYTYDDAPNPYKFPELSGDYLSAGKYQSENNVIEVTNDLNTKSTISITYNTNGYPISIVTTSTKRILNYQ